MEPWINIPAIIPEFDLEINDMARTTYPVSISGHPARVVECAQGWVLMIKLSVPAEKETWYRTASLLLVANRLFRFTIIERDNIWWLACRYTNEILDASVSVKIDLQLSIAVYLGVHLSGVLQRASDEKTRHTEDNERLHYFNGMV